jgi:serine/threonine protein kinase
VARPWSDRARLPIPPPFLVTLLAAIERRLPPGFSIEGPLGSGATSWVYVARDARGEALVVKIMQPGRGHGPEHFRFLREMQILRALDHPRIVPLLSPGEANGALFFTMPFVAGETLRARLAREGTLPLSAALIVCRDVADALDHAHARGVVHRDIKPDNILLAGGRAFLLDFGYANAPALLSVELAAAEAQVAFGTPDYMSPEQVTGRRAEDWRSDLFSLACVLHESLAGRPPFAAATARAALQRRLQDAPDDVRLLRPEVPSEVVAIIRRNLAVAPNDRFFTAGAFRQALDTALAQLDETAAV